MVRVPSSVRSVARTEVNQPRTDARNAAATSRFPRISRSWPRVENPLTRRPWARRGQQDRTVSDPRPDDHDQAAQGQLPSTVIVLLADPPTVTNHARRQTPWATSSRAPTRDHPSRRRECCPRTVRGRVADPGNGQPVRPPSSTKRVRTQRCGADSHLCLPARFRRHATSVRVMTRR